MLKNKDKENHERSKREVTNVVQGILNKISSRFLRRNHGSKKGNRLIYLSAETETKNKNKTAN